VPQQLSASLAMQLLDTLRTEGTLGNLKAPGISIDGAILYMHGPLEASYRKNLTTCIEQLLDRMPSAESCVMAFVTDPMLPGPVKVRLVAGDVAMADGV
jgi:hypothetical protein